jgi:hypothetical protein
VVLILLIEVTIPELFVAFTWNICHINFAINSLFYFFVSQECREELNKSFCGEGKTEAQKLILPKDYVSLWAIVISHAFK